MSKALCGALCLALLLAAAWPVPAAELRVVAIDSFDKKRLSHDGPWNQLFALRKPPIAKKVEINSRTEFYAFFIDDTGDMIGQRVVFKWYHQTRPRLYVRPVTRVVTRFDTYPDPVALDYIWSSPAMGAGLWASLGLKSAGKRETWNASRCYGPRTVRVYDVRGRLLAEKSFAIYHSGQSVF